MTSRKVQEDIATSSQISTKKFYGQRSSRAKIGIGQYDINKDVIDTGVEVLNASSNSEGESEEEFSPASARTYDSVLFPDVESKFLET